MAIAKWKLVVVNFSGVIYTLLVITAVTIINVFYTCPSLYNETDCFWTLVFAIIIIFQINVNLALFHYFNKRNQISYWTVKSNAFLLNGDLVQKAKKSSDGSTAKYSNDCSATSRRWNGNCSITMPLLDEQEQLDCRFSCAQEDVQRISSSFYNGSESRIDFIQESSADLMATQPPPKPVQKPCPQQHTLNHYQHMSSNNRLYATTDGIYRREQTLTEMNDLLSPPSPTNNVCDSNKSNQIKFCVECNKTTPKRCHHCPICNICVLRKDHHCFLTGGCVGLANQRYFIVFLFWAVLGAGYGAMINFFYLNLFVSPWYPLGWFYYIGPIALARWFLGLESFWHMCLAVLFSVSFSSFIGALVFLFLQIFYTLHGYTMHDYHVSRLQDHLESDGDNFSERLALVFGKRWWMNFLIPQFWLPNQMTPAIAKNVFISISKDL